MTVYDVPLSRLDEMSDASADAFIGNNDPIGSFLFDHEPNHLALKQRFFGSLVTFCSPSALRLASSKKIEAISIWFPPGMGHDEDVEADPFRPEDFADPETFNRLEAVGRVITELTADIGNEPQWYLHLVAVHPDYMNQGLASRLLPLVLMRAREDGLPCTLITQSAGKVHKCLGHPKSSMPCAATDASTKFVRQIPAPSLSCHSWFFAMGA
ncbi:MAG: GNAT family N-acetyltransferase [Fluviibacter sp.]